MRTHSSSYDAIPRSWFEADTRLGRRKNSVRLRGRGPTWIEREGNEDEDIALRHHSSVILIYKSGSTVLFPKFVLPSHYYRSVSTMARVREAVNFAIGPCVSARGLAFGGLEFAWVRAVSIHADEEFWHIVGAPLALSQQSLPKQQRALRRLLKGYYESVPYLLDGGPRSAPEKFDDIVAALRAPSVSRHSACKWILEFEPRGKAAREFASLVRDRAMVQDAMFDGLREKWLREVKDHFISLIPPNWAEVAQLEWKIHGHKREFH